MKSRGHVCRGHVFTSFLVSLVLILSLVVGTGFTGKLESLETTNHSPGDTNNKNIELQTISIDNTTDEEIIFYIDKGSGLLVAKNDSEKLNHQSLEDKTSKKIMVKRKDYYKDDVDGKRYFYDLNRGETRISLQLGSGAYQITLLKHSSGQNYTVVESKEVEIELQDNYAPYLNSTWPVNWEDEMEGANLAGKLTENIVGDREKAAAIYKYITENIDYDFDKINYINNSYVPEIDEVLSEKTGICYDYSVLFAGMLRSIDIPTKLVKGYKADLEEYHAWNEVYLKDEDKWIVVDTTYDSALGGETASTNMIKDPSEYDVHRIY